ncbi:MAG: glucose 1-dehydrogenase [Phenylobacterium sp.]|uniref:glucose 1-dehydrogenase n=1 Tax=Phenylobacterium sp. TaxID=1871053 RepID=UPI00391D3CA2
MGEAKGMRLTGRTAIVTGGASGFGEGIVRRFVEEGARVAIVDLNVSAAQALAGELGDAAIAVGADVSKDADVARLAAEAVQKLGPVEILVNNAGVGHTPQPLETLSDADFDRIWAVNVKSVYLTARHIVPAMKAARRGAILNVASTGGVSPRPNLTWYNASKGWMITATRAMAVELAPFGVRVNAINPVAGETPLLKTFMGEDTPEVRARFLASIPLGRFSTPADMGAAAAFLCSDDASMVTGVAMEVDGGRCI